MTLSKLVRKWWVWIIVAGIIGGIINLVDPTPPNAPTTAATATPAPTTEPTITISSAPALDWATSEITDKSVRTAVANHQWDKSIQIINSVKTIGGSIDIHVPVQFDTESKDQLIELGDTMVVFAEVLFQNPGVKSVVIEGDSLTFNVNGKDTDSLAASIVWDRSTITGVDYISYRKLTLVDYKKPFLNSKDYDINPLVYKMLPAEDKKMIPSHAAQ